MLWSYRRRPSGRRRLVIGLLVLGVVALGLFGVGRLIAGAGSGGFPDSLWHLLGLRMAPPGAPEGSGAPAEAGLPAQGDGQGDAAAGNQGGAGDGSAAGTSGAGDLLTSGAVFAWTVDYQLCGCEATEVAPAQPGLVGLSRDQLATELRDWEITAFSAGRVEARRTELAVMCPKHSKRTLRLENGKLALYAGPLGDRGVKLIPLALPQGYEDFTEASLMASEAEILRAGRVFDNQEQVVRYLEGLAD